MQNNHFISDNNLNIYDITQYSETHAVFNAKVMQEMGEQMKDFDQSQMPVDMKRMAYGGFQVEVEG
jgi:uncharacterized protein YbaA (DUF1428 family)